MKSSNEAIKIRDLWRIYKRGSETINACAGIDLDINRNEILAIVGRSGSGKTTLLNLIGGLDTPSRGIINIDGIDISRLKEKDLVSIRRNMIGFIFQLFYLIPTLTVRENVELPLIFARKKRNVIAHNTLRRVGIESIKDMLPRQLDGGSMQKVAIARALVNDPQILIADEPTGRLEIKAKQNIIDIFSKLKEQGLTIIIATHDLALAEQADRQIRLSDGKIVLK